MYLHLIRRVLSIFFGLKNGGVFASVWKGIRIS